MCVRRRVKSDAAPVAPSANISFPQPASPGSTTPENKVEATEGERLRKVVSSTSVRRRHHGRVTSGNQRESTEAWCKLYTYPHATAAASPWQQQQCQCQQQQRALLRTARLPLLRVCHIFPSTNASLDLEIITSDCKSRTCPAKLISHVFPVEHS